MNSSFIGKVIDNYRILEDLGRGGMGFVFKALNVKLDKLVAIKMIAPGLAMNENFLRRFKTEAKALARLENPNIVRINDLRECNDQWFIVMEYVDGITLGEKIRLQGAIPWTEALSIFKQMLNAIDHAHSVDIIHRDIKPNNVIITPEGVVKITDFGLAKDKQNLGHTQTNATGGTLFYMSPEQVKGLTHTDFRSDTYALGFTLYEMLAGKVPFEPSHTDFDIREAIVRSQLPPPAHFNPDIPPELNEIVIKAIEKDPDARFQSVSEMLNAIEQFELKQSAGYPVKQDVPAISDQLADDSIPVEDLGDTTLKEDQSKKIAEPAEVQFGGKEAHFRKPLIISASIISMIILLIIIGYSQNIHKYFLEMFGFSVNSLLVITSQPENATVFLNGDSIGVTPIKNLPVSAGAIQLEIQKTDFLNIDTLVTAESGFTYSISFNLEPQEDKVAPSATSDVITDLDQKIEATGTEYGSISITSNPVGASIWLSDEFVGKTPYRNNRIQENKYKVVIRMDGYEPFRKQVNVHKGRTARVNTNLQKFSGSISIESNPAGASIWLDDIETKNGVSPLTIDKVPVGDHKIIVKKKGYSDYSTQVAVKKNETLKITTKLNALMGELQVHVKPWGSIFIDNQLMKENTNVIYKVELSATEHQVRVTHPTFGICEKNVEIEENKLIEMVFDFNQFVMVSVTAFDLEGNPLWGDIIVDGENTGQVTPKEIKLRLGLHKITVSMEGYTLVDGEKQIMFDENFKTPQKFILRRNM